MSASCLSSNAITASMLGLARTWATPGAAARTPASSRAGAVAPPVHRVRAARYWQTGEADGHERRAAQRQRTQPARSHRCDRSWQNRPIARAKSRARRGLKDRHRQPRASQCQRANLLIAARSFQHNNYAPVSQPAHELGVSRLVVGERMRRRIRASHLTVSPSHVDALRSSVGSWCSRLQPYGCEMRSINHSGMTQNQPRYAWAVVGLVRSQETISCTATSQPDRHAVRNRPALKFEPSKDIRRQA